VLRKIFLCLFFVGCAAINPQPSSPIDSSAGEGYFFQKDLQIREGGNLITGFGVLPKQASYHLEMRSKKDAEVIRVSNCHRDLVFYEGNDKFTYRFSPNMRIEDGSCLLLITFLDNKGFDQYGAISFRGDETVPAVLSCNGVSVPALGASACQAKSGTMQGIEFKELMKVKAADGCELPQTNDGGKFWIYTVKTGFCLYLFKSDKNGEFHKLTTFGYNDVLTH